MIIIVTEEFGDSAALTESQHSSGFPEKVFHSWNSPRCHVSHVGILLDDPIK